MINGYHFFYSRSVQKSVDRKFAGMVFNQSVKVANFIFFLIRAEVLPRETHVNRAIIVWRVLWVDLVYWTKNFCCLVTKYGSMVTGAFRSAGQILFIGGFCQNPDFVFVDNLVTQFGKNIWEQFRPPVGSLDINNAICYKNFFEYMSLHGTDRSTRVF